MKILIISDLHGNAEALGALHESYDELRVLGDLVHLLTTGNPRSGAGPNAHV